MRRFLKFPYNDRMNKERTIALALTGASGMPYAIRLIEKILESGARLYLIYSAVAQIVIKQEMGLALPSRASEAEDYFVERFKPEPGKLRVFGREEWFAPVTSGSNPPDAMVVCPCTMGSLAAFAAGMSQNIIERAVDVMLKERRKLVIVPRETPFSTIHLENMLRLARAGAVILPANPGFYQHPQSVDDLVDYIVARILDHLDIPQNISARWGEIEGEA